ncbi:MAG: flagellar hook capping FlgD N-terminal domain-containing protein [Terriglobales bacterium]|jgi:flagellar basal-body rod modification protein FlgD
MITNPLSMNLPGTAAATSSTATTPNQAANNAEATFMNLLVTELQSQDPTSPMDPTQMVGQMLSMNQLNELIAINQTLQTALGTPTTSSQTGSSAISSLTGAH